MHGLSSIRVPVYTGAMNRSVLLRAQVTAFVSGALLCLIFSSQLHADEEIAPSLSAKPRWEIGVAGGYFSGFDYPASNDPNRRAIALPYFIYRTPIFRVGDGGVRAVAIKRPKWNLDLSISGSLNASSEGNQARVGMPDLDFLFEIGPQLKARVFDKELSDGGRLQLTFTTELRAVFATDFKGIDGEGFVAEAGLGLVRRGYLNDRLTLVGLVDVTFATEELHDYFYQVTPEFVTPDRPLHDARGGYLGTSAFVGLGFRASKRLRFFLGGVAGFYGGAANDNSALHETNESFGYVLGVSWTLAVSKEMIDVSDIELSRSE